MSTHEEQGYVDNLVPALGGIQRLFLIILIVLIESRLHETCLYKKDNTHMFLQGAHYL